MNNIGISVRYDDILRSFSTRLKLLLLNVGRFLIFGSLALFIYNFIIAYINGINMYQFSIKMAGVTIVTLPEN